MYNNMQKRGVLFVLILSVLVISLSSVYAFSLSDFFGNLFNGEVTGNAIQGSNIPSGLVAYYKFDGNALDSSGNGINGVVGGGESYVLGKFGNAFDFNGINQYVEFANSNSPKLGNNHTITGWVYSRNNLANAALISKWCGICYSGVRDARSYVVDFSNGKMDYGISTSGGQLSSGFHVFLSNSVLPVNQWVFFAVTYNGTRRTIYINGIEDNHVDRAGDIYQSNADVQIGATKDAGYRSFFNGSIDEVRFYNRILSLEEITSLYNSNSVVVLDNCTSFTYSNWSSCSSSGTQTRTVLSSSPSGCTGGNPILTQNCSYVSDLSCSDGIMNGDETGIDCGGSCSSCVALSSCSADSDCPQPSIGLSCEGSQSCLYQGVSVCINPGTSLSYCNLSQNKQCSPCVNGCESGVCKSGILGGNCIDSENGVSYYVPGNVNYNGKDYPDNCDGDLLMEYSCFNNALFGYPIYNCSLENKICQNGVCINNKGIINSCDGCEYGSTCLPVGYRIIISDVPSYCDIYGIAPQKVNQENETQSCQNSYECSSNICSSGQCVELEGFNAVLIKILCRITTLFNTEENAYENCVAQYVYGACVSSWNCSDWSVCAGGKQNRTCNDVKNCTTPNNLPNLTQSCSIIQSPVCGNNITEQGEECDDGNVINGDGCSENCTIENVGLCGNDVVDAGEECDGADWIGDSCIGLSDSLGEPYVAGNLSCSSSCKTSAENCYTQSELDFLGGGYSYSLLSGNNPENKNKWYFIGFNSQRTNALVQGNSFTSNVIAVNTGINGFAVNGNDAVDCSQYSGPIPSTPQPETINVVAGTAGQIWALVGNGFNKEGAKKDVMKGIFEAALEKVRAMLPARTEALQKQAYLKCETGTNDYCWVEDENGKAEILDASLDVPLDTNPDLQGTCDAEGTKIISYSPTLRGEGPTQAASLAALATDLAKKQAELFTAIGSETGSYCQMDGCSIGANIIVSPISTVKTTKKNWIGDDIPWFISMANLRGTLYCEAKSPPSEGKPVNVKATILASYDYTCKGSDNCGNNKIDAGEDCDGSDLNGKVCADIAGADSDGILACGSDCTFDTTGCGYSGCGDKTCPDGSTPYPPSCDCPPINSCLDGEYSANHPCECNPNNPGCINISNGCTNGCTNPPICNIGCGPYGTGTSTVSSILNSVGDGIKTAFSNVGNAISGTTCSWFGWFC
jgi:cysteine-rich repeat protein